MVAAVEIKPNEKCIIRWTGKTGMMTVSSQTYCGLSANAAAGVEQVPTKAIGCADCKAKVLELHGVAFDAT